MELTQEQREQLTEDGDRVELDDGRRVVLVIEPDQDTSIFDEQGEGVWCGRLEWVAYRDGRDTPRPTGFDGRARKLHTRDGFVWWQVPADVPQESIRGMGQQIIYLIEYGYLVVGLKVWERCDHAEWHEVDATYRGGVDAFYPELIEELAGELT
jgi:hypothetical protein